MKRFATCSMSIVAVALMAIVFASPGSSLAADDGVRGVAPPTASLPETSNSKETESSPIFFIFESGDLAFSNALSPIEMGKMYSEILQRKDDESVGIWTAMIISAENGVGYQELDFVIIGGKMVVSPEKVVSPSDVPNLWILDITDGSVRLRTPIAQADERNLFETICDYMLFSHPCCSGGNWDSCCTEWYNACLADMNPLLFPFHVQGGCGTMSNCSHENCDCRKLQDTIN